jgi:hypothetical protein
MSRGIKCSTRLLKTIIAILNCEKRKISNMGQRSNGEAIDHLLTPLGGMSEV